MKIINKNKNNHLWSLFFINIVILTSIALLFFLCKKKIIFKEHFSEIISDFYKTSEEKYIRIPYARYRTSQDKKSDEGFVEIEDFLMQWGTSGGSRFRYPIPFKDCYGAYVIPKGKGRGNETIYIRHMDNTGGRVRAGSVERPYYWFALGSRVKDEDEE